MNTQIDMSQTKEIEDLQHRYQTAENAVLGKLMPLWWGVSEDDFFLDPSLAAAKGENETFAIYKNKRRELSVQRRLLSALRISWKEYAAVANGLDCDITSETDGTWDASACGSLKDRGLGLRFLLQYAALNICWQYATNDRGPLIVPTEQSQCPDPLPVSTNRMIAEKVNILTGRKIIEHKPVEGIRKVRTFRGTVLTPQQPREACNACRNPSRRPDSLC